jgi:hypothetical protein
LDLRIQPLPPETLAAQRPAAEPARPAVAPVATPGQGGGTGGAANNGGTETPREQYVSPFITIDPTSGLVITQYRDSSTGELQQQYPSEKVVRQYRNLQPPSVSPSGGRIDTAAGQAIAGQPTAGQPVPGQPASPVGSQGDAVTIGRLGSGTASPAQIAAPATPAPAQAPAAPTGGVDKGSA